MGVIDTLLYLHKYDDVPLDDAEATVRRWLRRAFELGDITNMEIEEKRVTALRLELNAREHAPLVENPRSALRDDPNWRQRIDEEERREEAERKRVAREGFGPRPGSISNPYDPISGRAEIEPTRQRTRDA